MYSTHNEGISVVAEKFIIILKNKIYKYVTSISKNVYTDELDDIVTYHSTIKMKRTDVKSNTYIDSSKEITQPTRDVPGTSPDGPLKVLTCGTSRGPSGDSQGTNTKIDDLMKKLFFRCNSPCFRYLFLLFTGKTNIQKV